jgi:hypothetical protein
MAGFSSLHNGKMTIGTMHYVDEETPAPVGKGIDLVSLSRSGPS